MWEVGSELSPEYYEDASRKKNRKKKKGGGRQLKLGRPYRPSLLLYTAT